MRSVYGWSMLAVMCLASVALAQVRDEPRPASRPGAQRPGAAPVAAPGAIGNQAQGTPDQQIAATLWAANRNEVELAKLAQQKAQSDSVKEFAATAIKDHTQAADKFARAAGNLVSANTARGGVGTTPPRDVRKPVIQDDEARDETREEAPRGKKQADREDREDARDNPRREAREDAREEGREVRRTGREEAREGRTTTQRGGAQGFNWVSVHLEVADQCLQSAKKELNDKQGAEFDKCYMGLQVAAHMGMVDQLEVLKNHASSQLQPDIEQALETTKEHLEEAKKIMENIKDKPDNAGKTSGDRKERGQEDKDR